MKTVPALASILLVMVLGVTFAQQTDTVEPCMDDESRERVRNLMIDGIDTALKSHVQRVFDIWMKDPSGQPKRAKIGMHEGISAYVRSRAEALKWSPPLCSGAIK